MKKLILFTLLLIANYSFSQELVNCLEKFNMKVIPEVNECTTTEATSGISQGYLDCMCENRKIAKKKAAAKENKQEESSKAMETKTVSSGGNSNNNESENEKYENEDFDDGGQASRNIRKRREEAEAERQRMFKQSMDNTARDVGKLVGNFIGDMYERREQAKLKELEEKQIEKERIAEKKRIEEERRILEDERLNKLKNKPEYVNFLDNALNDVFYFDSSGKEVDQKNATFEQVYIKQENGFYVAKYFNIKDSYLALDVSYEIIPNPHIESLQTGLTIKYGPLNTKDESYYFYRNKLKQKTINSWWVEKISFEFYNYKDEKVFGSGDILKPETMYFSSSGAITEMVYYEESKKGKLEKHRFHFDNIGNITSLYITNDKGYFTHQYKFDQ
jgi:hypothetical protein